MKIRRSSWHYKISNLGGFERTNDNLCCYFWRLVGKLALIFVSVALFCLFIHAYFTHDFLISNTIMILFICSLFALPSLAIHFVRKKLGKPPKMPCENIVVEYIAAKKRKICPLIVYF